MPEKDLEQLIQQVLVEIKDQPSAPDFKILQNTPTPVNNQDGVFSTVDEAVLAAHTAYEQLQLCSLEKRKKIIASIREQALLHAKELAYIAFEETRFGDAESKVQKNILVAKKTPGPEILESFGISGDHGLTIIERAPFGVVGSITPSTNPTATIINNAISIISGGNSVVFNVHPRAKKVSTQTVQLLNQAIQKVTGPANLLTVTPEPTIVSAQSLMTHPGINLLLVTGGPAVVKVAMQSGKRAICAGPGNPPHVVDETANIERAATDLVKGASFDNNLPCTCEKEAFIVENITDQLKKAMCVSGAFELKGDQIQRLEKLIFLETGNKSDHACINPAMVGQSAERILKEIGVQVDKEIKLIILEVQADHPLVMTEQMMPVLPIVRVRNFEEAVEQALRAEQGCHHCAGIHSLDLRHLSQMAKVMATTIFVKNGPHYCGLGFESEGFTSFSIGTFTREGLTTARSFTWERRCVLADHFRIV
jgi:acyl-CoA reductase-like NAD-dependent aldehyde dehydrogenase